MREILFRGKRKDNGEWVEGYYTFYPYGFNEKEKPEHAIRDTLEIVVKLYIVDPETVCQYTGLTDKNDRKIFEGDIVSVSLWNLSRKKIIHTGVVKYDVLAFVVQRIKENDSRFLGSFKGDDPFGNPMGEIEVIGNIFDNPELLVGEEED